MSSCAAVLLSIISIKVAALISKDTIITREATKTKKQTNKKMVMNHLRQYDLLELQNRFLAHSHLASKTFGNIVPVFHLRVK